MTYGLKDIYKEFLITNPESKVSYNEAKAIWKEGNEMFVDEVLLEGKRMHLGSNLSYLQIRRIERNYNKPRINFIETKKLRAAGEEKATAYWTDNFYMMFYWNKDRCKIPNKTVYRFRPVRGVNGVTKKLTALIKNYVLGYKKFDLHKKITR